MCYHCVQVVYLKKKKKKNINFIQTIIMQTIYSFRFNIQRGVGHVFL